MVLDPLAASKAIGLLAAIYLLIAGIIHTVRGLARRRVLKRTNLMLIRGIAGLVVGGIILVMAVFQIGSLDFGYTVLAIGLILFGAIGLFSSFFQREGKAFAWGPVLVNLALLVWGILVFVGRSQNWNLALISGWILVLIGVVILVWTFLARKAPEAEADTAP
jgi:uncharacterized membrane protein HdeD (DUF308 family)